jgi:hypothetical protein
MSEDALDRQYDEMISTLRRTDERLRGLVQATMERVLVGSTDREAMELAYAGLRGEASAADGLHALRSALAAEGMDEATISHIEALYLNVLVGA